MKCSLLLVVMNLGLFMAYPANWVSFNEDDAIVRDHRTMRNNRMLTSSPNSLSGRSNKKQSLQSIKIPKFKPISTNKQVSKQTNQDDGLAESSSPEMAEVFKSLNLPPNFADIQWNPLVEALANNNLTIANSDLDLTSSPTLTALQSYPHQVNSYGHNTKSNFLGQLLRLLITIKTSKLPLLHPIIIKLAHASVHATEGAAGVTALLAKSLPPVADASAEVLKKLTKTFGHATGSLLYILSHLLSSAAWAKGHFTANHLPIILNSVGEASEGVASTVGTVAHGLADITHIVSSGLADTAKSKTKLFTKLVDTGHDIKAGALQGTPHSHSHGWTAHDNNYVNHEQHY